MRFEIILERHSSQNKDLFQQKVVKLEAADQSDARIRAKNEAKKLGDEWHILLVTPLGYWRK